MCGIAGIVSRRSLSPEHKQAITALGAALQHRGPDGAGHVHGDCFALASRRLTVIDLVDGAQPIYNEDKSLVLVCNGEIYNHVELRAEIDAGHAGAGWRGHSDTETLLACIEAWGIAVTMRRCIGMFAIALWDRTERRLHLLRDRLGEKPLYYGRIGCTLLFGSELKALREHPSWRGDVDREALALFFRYGYVPSPFSIHRGVLKLPAGSWLTIGLTDLAKQELPPAQAYWSLVEVVRRGVESPFSGAENDAIDRLDALCRSAVSLQCVADVPLGAFRSGGVDSSTVVALMQAQASQPVRTFTIGFEEAGFDEAPHAQAIARHLGTLHTTAYVTARDALKIIPSLPVIFDEPFSDPSQIPTFLVSKAARRDVTVSLSGDGGDELFGGYVRYARTRRMQDALRRMPRMLRTGVSVALRRCPPAVLDVTAGSLERFMPGMSGTRPSIKALRVANVLSSPNERALYRHALSHWDDPYGLVQGACDTEPALPDGSDSPFHANSFEQWMMSVDAAMYLPDDVLTKVDRAAMAVSLETRVPFLDHRIVEFAFSLPLHLKMREGQGKWLLRRLLDRYVPRALVDRPKMGFGVPIGTWLRGPLRDWAESLLDPARIRREGYLDPGPVRLKWDEHLSGRSSNEFYLWDVLMFQAWLDAQSAGWAGRVDAG
jgi:asparagine synthase (glutamine-hydrolysing)